MNQETAKKLFMEGGLFIFLDVPEGTEFGIDMKSWNTGEKFRGVKMIPPGIHYIFYSSVGICGEIAPRIGFYHNFRKGEVLVKKWDKEREDISNETVNESEIVKLKDNIQILDKFLGPYPYEILDKWKNLTSHMTEQLVSQLSPKEGKIRSALELMSCIDADRPRIGKTIQEEEAGTSKMCKRSRLSSSEDTEENLLPHLKPMEGTDFRFTQFPDKKYPDGCSASQITQHCMDSSYVLEVMITKYINPINILGEIEFSYICFLVGHSLEAFEHWKKMVSLLCSCENAIRKYRNIYDGLINILQIQIKEIPEEFLADIVTNNNFIYCKLRDLFRVIEEGNMDGRLKTKVERFKNDLTAEYSWDFTHLASEDEDDAPVIVEIN